MTPELPKHIIVSVIVNLNVIVCVNVYFCV